MQLIIAVLQLLFVTVSSALCCYLFLTLKRDLFRAEQRGTKERAGLLGRVDELERALARLRSEVEDNAAAPVQVIPGTGINMNKRSQALRMLKLGKGPEHVAAALSVPRKEVELLVKVQRMMIDSAGSTS